MPSEFRLCSTPFGITEVGTHEAAGVAAATCCAQRLSASQRSAPESSCASLLQPSSAQRLSASQRSARQPVGRPRRPHEVLNAFRHHRGRHPRGRLPSGGRRGVLNAFRHHRGRHASRAGSLPRRSKCSTPFGITEVGTLPELLADRAHNQCSTPFGITEVGTRAVPALAQQRGVLNAFRHHRGRHAFRHVLGDVRVKCSTPFGITEVGTREAGPIQCDGWSAQRLSASQRSAQGRRHPDPLGSAECSTPFGITEVGTGRRVHRDRLRKQCSTPFGITEVGTGNRLLFNGSGNACSTPFGITEVGTAGARRLAPTNKCAQRLSASQRSAPLGNGLGPLLFPVLNAFRHHRGRHSANLVWVRPNRSCSTPFGITEVGTSSLHVMIRSTLRAQRLSASQRSALPGGSSRRLPWRVLNAFRHHRGRHLANQGIVALGVSVLNAFRHHRGRHAAVI